MSDAIGYRGWCKKCRFVKVNGKKIVCKNEESSFYNLEVSSVLCAPCFEEDKSKSNIGIELISFD